MEERTSRWHRLAGWLRERLASRFLMAVLVLAVLAGSAWLFRRPLMRGAATYLVKEDALAPCDAIYVLGGSPLERGTKAVELWRAGIAPRLVCTGANLPASRDVACEQLTESQLTARVAMMQGADSASVVVLNVATSTWEEAEAVRAHAIEHGYGTIMVLSTDMHMRRVGRVFRKQLKGTGIDVKLVSAPGRDYELLRWWDTEEGMIMLVNEYSKLVYYWMKY